MKQRLQKPFCAFMKIALTVFVLGAITLPVSILAAPADKTVIPPSVLTLPVTPTPQEIFRSHAFEEPLVPIGGGPTAAENAALAEALKGYAKRSGPDDFSSLTAFLEQNPKSPWNAALLTDLGLEYYNTAHYSLALAVWAKAWALARDATDAKGKAIGDRAAGELAYMYARLGRMTDLEPLLKSVEGRVFVGPTTEKITGAREGLWNMQNRPEISFRCGPLALHRIKLATDPNSPGTDIIFNSASTQKGFSLTQVAELSERVGLNYQMAFRIGPESVKSDSGSSKLTKSLTHSFTDFIVPSVVHWKVGHYAAMVRQEGDLYLLEDPTFGNTVWASRQALEAETSGYFLIPPGALPAGWRAVETSEGETIWGKGRVNGGDPKRNRCKDKKSGGGDPCNKPKCKGMAVSDVHLMLVNLNITDTPVGYSPPVGPSMEFTVTYNHREAYQPGNFTYSNFGPKWTCDWISYITDNPSNTLADVNQFAQGGGTSEFTAFATNSQTFAFQQYDQTQLKRTSTNSYELTSPDGSKLIFSQPDGSAGTSRKIFLTQSVDPFGNTVTLGYDGNLRLTSITDAIGQVTTLTYGLTNDVYKITKVTDPFGRFATFDYDLLGRLTNITDVIGLTSRFTYENSGDFINSLITPYGTNTFIRADNGDTRVLETVYPDGSRDRVEFNQNIDLYGSDPAASVPAGMGTVNNYLQYRNTYYWSRNACALGYGDYSKATLYHWLHTADGTSASGILESTKEPLEARIWYDYAGQASANFVGNINKPNHVGRVLDDGSTQLYTYAYDNFGHLTNSVDPVGRTFSYIYATNGIDLLESRMTRAGKNELLSRRTYNAHQLPLTVVDAAGQTNTYTYNSRGQILTKSNPKNETTSYTYGTNGYLVAVDGPLPGTNDVSTFTYDSFGRVLTTTDVSGYTLTFEYDTLDRITKITHPDSTFEQTTYNRLDPAVLQDRAGRQTLLEYSPLRQLTKRTDPLGRVTQFQWCSCGDIKSLTDPMGRTTTWQKDLQNRLISKRYGDGSQITYYYENTTSRIRQVVDEKFRTTAYAYNLDDTLRSFAYANTAVPTPGVSFTYDPDYLRIASMTDGIGTTLYQYNPITSSPAIGASQLGSETGPWPNDVISYSYDESGRRISTTINGVTSLLTRDAADRVLAETNALGSFSYTYDGASDRPLSSAYPNGQTVTRAYGSPVEDLALQRLTHQEGSTPISEFLYGRDVQRSRITTWSQQAGSESPNVYSLAYDDADQLVSATVTNSGTQVNAFAYGYDPAGNRLFEQVGGATNTAAYNTLNQLSATTTSSGVTSSNEWDAQDRLVAVNRGSQRTEFIYDGLSRLMGIRQLTNGIESSNRHFLWCDDDICEERDALGAVTKRFFPQGVKLETGPTPGSYFYTRDHLGSIRELTDSGGNVRASYSYDPYGRRTRQNGDLEADFSFAGMFWSSEVKLALTHYRAYDPEAGRWLSRDPLQGAEENEGPNLYVYVDNNPANGVDPLGLCCEAEQKGVDDLDEYGDACLDNVTGSTNLYCASHPGNPGCMEEAKKPYAGCATITVSLLAPAQASLIRCLKGALAGGCKPPHAPPPPPKHPDKPPKKDPPKNPPKKPPCKKGKKGNNKK